MSISASEIEKMQASKKAATRRRYAEEFRVEVVQCYLKAREIDPKKTIKNCTGELEINEKTFSVYMSSENCATGTVVAECARR